MLSVAFARLMRRGGPVTTHDFTAAAREPALVEWWDGLTDEQRAQAAAELTAGENLSPRQLVYLAKTAFPLGRTGFWRSTEGGGANCPVPDELAAFIADRRRSNDSET